MATYDEIKQQIRDGTAVPVESTAPLPQRKVMPLDRIFALESPNRFVGELSYRVQEKASRGDGALTQAELTVHAIWGLEAEVNNGGFDQYFFNSSGDTGRPAVEALHRIGAAKMAAIAEKALRLFPDGRPDPDREARWRQMDAWGEAERAVLDALDREFYEYPDDIGSLLATYCRRHRDEFT